MEYPKIRTGLLTFILGVMSVSVFTPFLDEWNEPYVELPQVESNSSITVRVCSEEESRKFYRENGYVVVNKTKGINCNDDGGGGGSGGRYDDPIIAGKYINSPKKIKKTKNR